MYLSNIPKIMTCIKGAKKYRCNTRSFMITLRWWKKYAQRSYRRIVKQLIQAERFDNINGMKPRLTAWDLD